jgi:Raf kinase inhibitor-like YbhB/YbcL family protein
MRFLLGCLLAKGRRRRARTQTAGRCLKTVGGAKEGAALPKKEAARGLYHAGRRLVGSALVLALVLLLSGFGCASETAGEGGPSMAFSLTSLSFSHQGEIPTKYTCEGEDISPPLSWSQVPQETKSLVLIVDDPDAPDPNAPRMTWVHWVLYDLPPTATGLAEAATSSAMPAGTREGLNDWKRAGYGGPCPPIGRHRYFHKLYALDTVLGDLGTPTKAQITAAMEGHVVAEAQLIGTYQKKKK